MAQTMPRASDAPLQKSVRIVAIGTSAGGLKVLQQLLTALPKRLSWPVVIVQHLQPDGPSQLSAILNRCGDFPVKPGATGDRLEPNHVYIAPPGHHMVVTQARTIALTETPAVHFSRPAIDVLFQSVAKTFSDRAVAIILTGSNTDGAEGIRTIKAQGGLTIAQSPQTATAKRMPQAAIDTGAVDHVLTIEAIAQQLRQLA